MVELNSAGGTTRGQRAEAGTIRGGMSIEEEIQRRIELFGLL